MIHSIQRHGVSLAVLMLIFLAALARGTMYGDLRLSVGNLETHSYIRGSLAPALSWRFLAGPRLATTNLLYKFASDPQACPLTAVSNPALGEEVEPRRMPCFDRIAVVQNVLSIVGWSFLAWALSRWLGHPALRTAIAALVLGFGFTPQIAEWDSILGPESLSISLFAILLGLLAPIAGRMDQGKGPVADRVITGLAIIWLVVFTSWVFVRDVHLYTVPIVVAMLAAGLLRTRRGQRLLPALMIAYLVVIFLVGYFAARDGRRANIPLTHAFEAYVLPYPSRVEFLRRFGIPDPESARYAGWFNENATRTYAAFLLSHPGFVASTLWEHAGDFQVSNVQEYFRGTANPNREWLIRVGEMLHPQTNAVYLVVLLLCGGLWLAAFRTRDAWLQGAAWMAAWMLFTAMITQLASFFGDYEGFRRHLAPSVAAFRLLFWLLLFVCLDRVLWTGGHVQMDQQKRSGARLEGTSAETSRATSA